MLSRSASGRKAILVILLVTLSAIITTGGWFFIQFQNYNSPSVSHSKLRATEIKKKELVAARISQVLTSEILHDFLPVKGGKAILPHPSKTIAFVNPPMKEFKPEPVSKDIIPSEGGFLESERGSIVQIPPNAFIDDKGNPLSEKVNVQFTEYSNYKDIFFSGIPMVYKVKDIIHQFESAGMMQLEASAQQGVVYVNPQSQIKVMLASNATSTDYNLYYFDKSEGNWKEKGKDQVVYKKKKLKRTAIERKMAAYEPKKREVFLTSFEGLPQDKVFLWWHSSGKEFDFIFTRMQKSYPELKALSGMKWEYRGEDAKEVYAKLFNEPVRDKKDVTRRGQWESCTFARNDATDFYTLTVYGQDESFTINVRPSDRSEKNLLKTRKRFEKHEADLIKRHKSDEAAYARYQSDSTAYLYDKAELASTSMDVMRSFQVDNFGIWNCDRVLSQESLVTFNLRFVDENNKPLKVDVVYIASKEFNSVFNFLMDGDQNIVRMNPFSNNLLWAILPGNKLAVVSPEKIWALQGKKGRQQVIMKVSDDPVASIEEVRAGINF